MIPGSRLQFGLSLSSIPIGSTMSEIGAKLMEAGSSLGNIPVTNIPGPPISFYKDSFQYLKNRNSDSQSAQEHSTQDNSQSTQPQSNNTTSAIPETVLPSTPESQPIVEISNSATLSNSPFAINSDLTTAQQFDNLTRGFQPIDNVSPI